MTAEFPPSSDRSRRGTAGMVIRPLFRIRPEIGLSFIAVTKQRQLSSHDGPSSAIVLEDGVPLPGPANAVHDDIRQAGGGRYSFWHNRLYFSTPDGSDPRTNGRTYTIAYCPGKVVRRSLLSGWRRAAAETMDRFVFYFRAEKRRQALWGAFYRLCFAYVLWKNKAPRAQRK